jgi:hypothetical protein
LISMSILRVLGVKTYSAAAVAADSTVGVIEGTVLVTALIAQVVTDELNVEVELLVGGGGVGEDGKELSRAGVANTEVEGSPVTDGLAAIAPLATLLSGNTLGVDVVLSGGGLALPVEVGVAVRAGQGVGGTGGGRQRNCLGLGTGVVSTADGDIVGHLVLYVDTANTLNAKLLVGRVGAVELATLTLQTTDGLASASLGSGPLGLLVTSGTGVRAHGTAVALITGNSSDNVTDQVVNQGHVLDTGVATQTEVVEGNGTIFGGEGTTVDLSIGEFGGETSGTGVGGAGGAAGSGNGSRAGGAGGLDSAA